MNQLFLQLSSQAIVLSLCLSKPSTWFSKMFGWCGVACVLWSCMQFVCWQQYSWLWYVVLIVDSHCLTSLDCYPLLDLFGKATMCVYSQPLVQVYHSTTSMWGGCWLFWSFPCNVMHLSSLCENHSHPPSDLTERNNSSNISMPVHTSFSEWVKKESNNKMVVISSH